MSVASPSLDLNPPEAGRWGRPVGMALVVHAALMVALAWGVGWQKDAVVVFEAEVWSALPQVAAPRAAEPEPKPVEPVVETPQPAPTSAPPPPPPQAKAPQVVTQKTPPKPEPKPEPRPPAKQPAEPDRARQQQAQREAERVAREREAQRRAEQQRQAQQEAERQRNIERMLGQANSTGSTRSTGQAAQASGANQTWAGKVEDHIHNNIHHPRVVTGKPETVVEIWTNSSGLIIRFNLKKSSGDLDWDRSVIRAIERARSLPLDESGKIPYTNITITVSP